MQQKRLIIALVSIAAGLLLVAGYFAYRAGHTVPLLESDEEVRIAEEVGRKAELPARETPTLATVTNKDRLDGQAFFRSAENGDKILIYPRAGRAVLYRPSTGKVLEMTGIDIEKYAAGTSEEVRDGQAPSTQIQVPVQISVVLYNGTRDTGALDEVAKIIGDRFHTVMISGRQAAAKRDYEESFVMDLSGSNSDMAALIAQAIGGTVLPHVLDGEPVPNADILVIIGKK